MNYRIFEPLRLVCRRLIIIVICEIIMSLLTLNLQFHIQKRLVKSHSVFVVLEKLLNLALRNDGIALQIPFIELFISFSRNLVFKWKILTRWSHFLLWVFRSCLSSMYCMGHLNTWRSSNVIDIASRLKNSRLHALLRRENLMTNSNHQLIVIVTDYLTFLLYLRGWFRSRCHRTKRKLRVRAALMNKSEVSMRSYSYRFWLKIISWAMKLFHFLPIAFSLMLIR